MRISDSRYDSERASLDQARRMVAYQVRTKIIEELTGLSMYTIQNLWRQYADLSAYKRKCGEAPYQPAFFSRTRLRESETSALALIELEMKVIPSQRAPAGDLPSRSERVERLLRAFDLFRTLVPQSELSFEHALLLARELTRGKTLGLESCPKCRGVMVVDRLGDTRTECAFCRKRARPKNQSAKS